MAAASSFSIWRRSSFGAVMMALSAPVSAGFDGVKDERGGIDVRQQRDGVERGAEAPASGASITTTSLPRGSRPWISQPASATIAASTSVEAFGARLHHDAGDFAAGRRDDAIGCEHPAGDQCAAVDCSLGLSHDAVLRSRINAGRAGREGRRTSGRSRRQARSRRPFRPRGPASDRGQEQESENFHALTAQAPRVSSQRPTYSVSSEM